jgi:hypothetical protein
MESPTAEQVRLSRVRAGLTQEQAAAAIYVPGRCWQRYEAGITKMHPAFWELFRFKAYGVRPNGIDREP